MLHYPTLLATLFIALPVLGQHGEERISTVYVVNADGSGEHALFPYPARVTFLSVSPDGARIAYAGKGPDIWIADMDGGNSINFTDTADIQEYNPVWSPDGTKIAYSARNGSDSKADIVLKDVASGATVNITNSPSNEGSPSWSPDGSQIVFSSDRDGTTQLYVAAINSGPWINITNGTTSELHCLRPAWSPLGTHIVYATRSITGTKIGTVTVPNGTHQEIPLKFPLPENVQPAWSPDGTRLVFATAVDGGIKILELASGRITNLTHGIGINDRPAWTPDGRIIFVSARTATEMTVDLGPDTILIIIEGGGLGTSGRDGDTPPVVLQRTMPSGKIEHVPLSKVEAERLLRQSSTILHSARHAKQL